MGTHSDIDLLGVWRSVHRPRKRYTGSHRVAPLEPGYEPYDPSAESRRLRYTDKERLVLYQALPEGGYVPPAAEAAIAGRLIQAGALRFMGMGRVEASPQGVMEYYTDIEVLSGHWS